MAAAAEDRGVFFLSFDTIETASEKRKKEETECHRRERVCVCVWW